MLSQYTAWILADVAFLLALDAVLMLVCYRWPRRSVIRLATLIGALICTWSIINAGWLIRTGTQILPRVLLPVFRDPANALLMVGVNLVRMPIPAIALLGPSSLLLLFVLFALVRPVPPAYTLRRFVARTVLFLVVALFATVLRPALAERASPHLPSTSLGYNCHLRALVSLALPDYRRPVEPERELPRRGGRSITQQPVQRRSNIVIVILEGIQYARTSLASPTIALTPYLQQLAGEGVVFTNARSTLTHTTKAVFALLTGRYPSASQDLAEAVPVDPPYASLATILADGLGYRTAFFQSARGDFEARPGLVHNLGFEKFFARDDLPDQSAFVGYLGADEFALLGPIVEWIRAGDGPFFLAVLCSVTHDPYEVPDWFGERPRHLLARYEQAIRYTDAFIAALDVELSKLNLTDSTIFCVVGDHGEGFGEHGLMGHERIPFDESLRIPLCLRVPFLLPRRKVVDEPVSSVDLVPTLLALLGLEMPPGFFDGTNVLGPVPAGRKVYFSGWMQEGPAGYVQGQRKFIYSPTGGNLWAYDLLADPQELVRMDLPVARAERIIGQIRRWRAGTIFKIAQKRTGSTVLFDRWICRWANRVASVQYRPQASRRPR